MKKIILQDINVRININFIHRITIVVCCMLVSVMMGCTYKDRGEYLGETLKSNDEQSDAMMQSVVDALESKDSVALKELFSSYALEHTENLDEEIETLMKFYPGCDGGYEGDCDSNKEMNYGEIVLTLEGLYTLSNDAQKYLVSFIMQPRNDDEPEKIGLYLIEIIEKDAIPKGFKLKSPEDVPGIYVHE